VVVTFNQMGEDAQVGELPAVARRALELRWLAVREDDVLWVGDPRGDILPEWLPPVSSPAGEATLAEVRIGSVPGAGVYHRGRRILSCCVLAVQGETLPAPAAAETATFEARLAFPQLRGRRDDLSAFRTFVADGACVQQWITLDAQSDHASPVRVTLTLACDGMLADEGTDCCSDATSYLDGATLRLAWRDGDDVLRHTYVVFDHAPLDVRWLGAYDIAGIPARVAVSFHLYPALAEPAVLGFSVAATPDEHEVPSADGFAVRAPADDRLSAASVVRDRHARALLDGALYFAYQPDLDDTLRRAASDLRLLATRTGSGGLLPLAGPQNDYAAGCQDALIAGLQSLALDPSYAENILRALAPTMLEVVDCARAGAGVDGAWQAGQSAALWVALLGEWLDWTGDLALVDDLLPVARGVLDMLQQLTDVHGYLRAPDSGGVRLEPQLYACMARRKLARALRHRGSVGDRAAIAALERDADKLRQQIERDFWLPNDDCYAPELTDALHPLTAVTSASAHALWSRVAAGPRAARLATRLTQPDVATGWGLRTCSAEHPHANDLDPSGGAVWTHETAFAAIGLLRTGHSAAGLSLARAVFDVAAAQLDARLPAYVGGQPRQGLCDSAPCWCFRASIPDAAAVASPIALVSAMLGCEPDARSRRLTLRPVLPQWLPRLTVRHLRVGTATLDIDVARVTPGGACEVSACVTSGGCWVLVRPPVRAYS
jgi:Mannosylglycerate hydrolase MGH1-like glycoside hydrolase domain/N-terminal domain of (some) glycogen debranching enzymes